MNCLKDSSEMSIGEAWLVHRLGLKITLDKVWGIRERILLFTGNTGQL